MNIFFQNVSAFTDPKDDGGVLCGIPEWRKEKILRYILPQDRKLSLGAWRLLEKALTTFKLSAADVTVGKNGKLECKGCAFSLSHSAEMVLCVAAKNPVGSDTKVGHNIEVGCDIEKVRSVPVGVAQRYFTPSEQTALDKCTTDEERNRLFFRLWTMKESYLKMTGEGLNFSPARVEINLKNMTVLRDNIPQPCTLQSLYISGYEISICEKK
jgi:4'-phosphopantetheinyl transferase